MHCESDDSEKGLHHFLVMTTHLLRLPSSFPRITQTTNPTTAVKESIILFYTVLDRAAVTAHSRQRFNAYLSKPIKAIGFNRTESFISGPVTRSVAEWAVYLDMRIICP